MIILKYKIVNTERKRKNIIILNCVVNSENSKLWQFYMVFFVWKYGLENKKLWKKFVREKITYLLILWELKLWRCNILKVYNSKNTNSFK